MKDWEQDIKVVIYMLCFLFIAILSLTLSDYKYRERYKRRHQSLFPSIRLVKMHNHFFLKN